MVQVADYTGRRKKLLKMYSGRPKVQRISLGQSGKYERHRVLNRLPELLEKTKKIRTKSVSYC